MRRTITLLSLLALMSAAAGIASASPALDAAGKCRDMKTKKFAKCSAANTEPVPEKK